MPRRLDLKIENKYKDRGAARLMSAVNLAKLGPYVKVGYPKESNPSEKQHYKEEATQKTKTKRSLAKKIIGRWGGYGITVLDIALAHEFGTDKLPERSFIRSSTKEGARSYGRLTKKLVNQIADGQRDLGQALNVVGLYIVNDIKKYIRLKKVKPPSRRALEQGGTTLWDTGQLINSLSYSIEVEGKVKPGVGLLKRIGLIEAQGAILGKYSLLVGESSRADSLLSDFAKIGLSKFGPYGFLASIGITVTEEMMFKKYQIQEVINPEKKQ